MTSGIPRCLEPASVDAPAGLEHHRRQRHEWCPGVDEEIRQQRIPAISWPITAGWPTRCISSPNNRPQTSSAIIWARKTISDDPCDPMPAAKPIAGTRQNARIASSAGIQRRDTWNTPLRFIKCPSYWARRPSPPISVIGEYTSVGVRSKNHRCPSDAE
jgi:hypothetical protein